MSNEVVRSKRITLTNGIDKEKINKESLKQLRKYKIDMGLRELSDKTIYNYITDIHSWLAYVYLFQENESVLDLEEDDLTEFFYYCKTEGNNSRRIKRRMSSISAFYRFLRKKKQISENPMEFIDRPRKDVNVVKQTFLTRQQVVQMEQELKELGDLQLLTYAMFSLSTMARVNAIVNLKWNQIDLDLRVANDVLEKEGKTVTLFFNNNTKKLLQRLQAEREEQEIKCDYVFCTKYRKTYDKVNNSTMGYWCKKIGALIDVPTLHPHDFRHSMATILKHEGMDLEDISQLLNHEGTDVTLKYYIAIDKEKVQATKDKFDIF